MCTTFPAKSIYGTRGRTQYEKYQEVAELPLKKFLNKIKYVLTIGKNVLILNALYKQYGSFRFVWPDLRSILFDENWLYCVGLLELCGYMNFGNFTNCSRTFGGHCMYCKQSLLFSVLVTTCVAAL